MTTALLQAFCEGFEPDPDLNVSEWADKYRVLSADGAAEAGQYRTDRTPFLREIMEVMSPQHPATDITVMKGTQLGVTEIGNNLCGFHIHMVPCPILMVFPKQGVMGDASKQRIDPMINNCPELAGLVSPNNVETKQFPGGVLFLRSARSTSDLKSMPIRVVIFDEIDEYPLDVNDQGDPIGLGMRRASTYGNRKKIVKFSTPTVEGRSRVDSSFQLTDQRYYFVPCPHCAHEQTLKWSGIKWEKDSDGKALPETAHYECEGCEKEIQEFAKTDMLRAGRWIATNPDAREGVVGFHISSLYSPYGWKSWEEIVSEFLDAKDDPNKLKEWINSVLGETWKARGDRPDWTRIKERAEDYKTSIVQSGALLLTCGVDVQKDRLEAEVVGWGPSLESWSVEHIVIQGDVWDDGPEGPWPKLSKMLDQKWEHTDGGEMGLTLTAVDTGYATSQVYDWYRTVSAKKVMLIKGKTGVDRMVGYLSKGKASGSGVPLWIVGVDHAKSWIYGKLELQPYYDEESGEISGYPDGYMHYPQYTPEFFKQLSAEKQVMQTDSKGYQKLAWTKEYERNEALDLRVYARISAEHLRVGQLKTDQWEVLKKTLKKSEHSQSRSEASANDTKAGARPRRPSAYW